MSPISPEITMIMIVLLCVKLALKHAAKGTRRVKPLPYDYARESVQTFE